MCIITAVSIVLVSAEYSLHLCYLFQCLCWKIWNTPTLSHSTTSSTRRSPSHWCLSTWWDTHMPDAGTHYTQCIKFEMVCKCVFPLCVSGQRSETVPGWLWKCDPRSQRQSEEASLSVVSYPLMLLINKPHHTTPPHHHITDHLSSALSSPVYFLFVQFTITHLWTGLFFFLLSSFSYSCCEVYRTVTAEKFSIETWNHKTCW